MGLLYRGGRGAIAADCGLCCSVKGTPPTFRRQLEIYLRKLLTYQNPMRYNHYRQSSH